MPDLTSKPILFLAFANDRQASGAYLRNLGQEAEQLRDVLAPAEQAGLCQVETLTSASAEGLLKRFHDPAHQGRIALFHYAGHAEDYDLLLESATGQRAIADGRGLAAFLRQQSGLHLVFLNACSTRAQVEGLLDAGIAAVIATARAVDDQVATDFARHFYTALAGGDSIRTSFDKAQAALHFGRGDLTRHLHPVTSPHEEHTAAGWPWQLYLRAGAEDRGDWNLPSAANDPLFGLPPLPPMDLPAKPFRDLSWFRRADAPIFFGRGQQIRQLYTTVTDSKAAPIVLFYGQSGVGKSSLLDAGLLPRLEQVQRVVYLRRDQEKGLLGTLRAHIPRSAEASEKILDAWRTAEQKANQPLTLILDQVEEHFTRPNKELPDEMSQFLVTLVGVFADRNQRPQGKLILSFRKEWLAEIEKRLIECELPCSKVFLERLDEAGVIEAVSGVATTPALHQYYGLTIDDDLAEEIAHDLLQDREAAVAPMLQILLTRLWEEATQRNRANPRFDQALYDQLRRDGLKLKEFLDRQLARLRAQQAEVVDSGLALDLLSFHTTPLGTAEQHDLATLEKEYHHREGVLAELVRNFQNLYLLVDPAADQADTMSKSRLAHDTLAPLVRARFDESDLPGQRARRILEARAVDWDGKDDPPNPTPLDRQDLDVVEAGETGMRVWKATEEKLIAASRQERERRQRVELILWVGGIAAVVLIAAFAGFAWLQWGRADQATIVAQTETTKALEAQKAEESAKKGAQTEAANARSAEATAIAERNLAKSGQLASQATKYLDDQYDLSLLLSLAAQQSAHTIEAQASQLSVLTHNLQLITYLHGHAKPVTSVAFSHQNKLLASGDAEGTLILWDLQNHSLLHRMVAAHDAPIHRIAFSLDDQILISANYSENTATFQEINAKVMLWRVADAMPIKQLALDAQESFEKATISPDGKVVAFTNYQNEVIFWDVMTDQYISRTTALGSDPIVTFGASSETLAWVAAPLTSPGEIATSGETVAGVWDIKQARAVQEAIKLEGHANSIDSTVFRAEGNLIATASYDGLVLLHHLSSSAPIKAIRTSSRTINIVERGMAFDMDDPVFALGDGQGVIERYDINTGQQIGEKLMGHNGDVLSLAFSTGTDLFASGGEDGKVILWGHSHNRLARVIDSAQSIFFSNDGETFAVLSNETVTLYKSDSGTQVGEPFVVTPSNRIWHFSSDKEQLVTSDDPGGNVVYVWDTNAGKLVKDPIEHPTFRLNEVAVNPNQQILATTSARGEAWIFLWDLVTRQQLSPLKYLDRSFTAIDFNLDGTLLASGTWEGEMLLWDVSTWTVRSGPWKEHSDWISSIAFSPNGRFIASGGSDRIIRLWDAGNGQPFGTPLVGHTDVIRDLAFSADGRFLTSSGAEGSIILWNVENGQQIGQMEGRGSQVVFDPRLGKLTLANNDTLWDLDANSWLGQLCKTANRNFTHSEWKSFMGGAPYQLTCPNLPIHPSIVEFAENLARAGEIEQAAAQFRHLASLQPDLQIEPDTEAQRIADESHAEALVTEGRKLALQGEITQAIDIFQQALQLNPALNFSPTHEAQRVANLIVQSEYLVRDGKVKEAMAGIDEVQAIDPQVNIAARTWNQLCRFASLWGYAWQIVQTGTCNFAVEFAKGNEQIAQHRESRAIAFMLSHWDHETAISDLTAYIEWSKESDQYITHGKMREEWLEEFESGNNPFDEETLKTLRNE